ncbi:MAG: mechanosensitive ion channel [Chitinivibrionales bacterium]|nr:mechanosensitive ion channel [Chitinivibrionales bacterium]
MNSNFDIKAIFFELLAFAQKNAITILVSLLIILLLERLFSWFAENSINDDRKRHDLKKWSKYIALALGLGWLLTLYYTHAKKETPFLLFLIGIILAGIAISLRDVFSNVVGWLLILSNKGYKTGDRIRIGKVTGDVIDIGILRTMLSEIGEWVAAEQSTGRLVTIPNSMMLTESIYNYTQGYDFIWNEFKVLVTFESDWQRAEDIIYAVAMEDFEKKKEQIRDRLKKVRRKFFLQYTYFTPKVYVSIEDSGVLLTLRSLVRARRRRTVTDELSRRILTAFAGEPSIEFAYPTMRIYRQGESGNCADTPPGC